VTFRFEYLLSRNFYQGLFTLISSLIMASQPYNISDNECYDFNYVSLK